jgi:Fic family protein
MNPGRFKNSTSGHAIQTMHGGMAYWAFLPNPLPPPLPADTELWLALSKADRALGELAGLGRSLSNPNLLMHPFIRREAVLSSRIEGTQAGIAALYNYEARQLSLFDETPKPREADVREVLNYVRALEYGMERLHSLPVSLRLIRELHERLMEDVRGGRAKPGEFRDEQNWIGPPHCRLEEATFIPPPIAEMHPALANFEKYLHAPDSYPPLVRLALLHYQFEAIHPFADGNGRIGRLLISLLLVHWDLLPMPLLYLSAFFEKRRREYYDLLMGVSERGEWRPWISFFLDGVAEQSCDAIERAKKLQDLQTEWRSRMQKARMTGLVLGIIDMLFERPSVSANDVANRFNVSHPAAMQALRRLVNKKILFEISGRRRNQLFLAKKIIRIVE